MRDPDDDFLYQPHRARGERLDPALRRMVMAAGGVSVLVIIVALAWSGFRTSGFGPPPVINPPDTPLRMAPQTPGGLVVPGADVPIMSGQTAPQGAPQLAPNAQAPDVAELNQAAGLNPPPPPAAAPVAPAQPAPAQPVSAPASTPAPSPAKLGGLTAVQLAATPDEPSAASTWASLQKKYPDLLGGKKPVIIPAVVNGNSVWRLRVSGFPSPDAAKSFCAQLTAKGAQCAVAAF